MTVRIKQSGTELYRRVIAMEYATDELKRVMVDTWKPTPWMVDAFTGDVDEPRRNEMQAWCREHFGPEGSPVQGRGGKWRRSCVTIYGWTWYGFATKDLMDEFVLAWPTPEGVVLL